MTTLKLFKELSQAEIEAVIANLELQAQDRNDRIGALETRDGG